MDTKRICSEPKWLDSLNADQRSAAKHFSGPLLVIAGVLSAGPLDDRR